MPQNDGTSLERLTREIFQEIVNQDEVKNIAVKRDVRLKGITTSHQVDVYWEFELGSVRYKTVVEVKDRKSVVSQGHVIKFKGVLDDLPGQPRGVIVSASGFQRGAREFATANGILLYELRA